jgi:hypothetical protein
MHRAVDRTSEQPRSREQLLADSQRGKEVLVFHQLEGPELLKELGSVFFLRASRKAKALILALCDPNQTT